MKAVSSTCLRRTDQMAKPASQLTGRMTSEERKAFGKYADALGLGAGTVATLLVIRELRLARLTKLKVNPRFRQPKDTPATITSHRIRGPQKLSFRDHLDQLDLSVSEGLGVLCRAELDERWLEAGMSDSKRVKI